jgi:hypothetical protein
LESSPTTSTTAPTATKAMLISIKTAHMSFLRPAGP